MLPFVFKMVVVYPKCTLSVFWALVVEMLFVEKSLVGSETYDFIRVFLQYLQYSFFLYLTVLSQGVW